MNFGILMVQGLVNSFGTTVMAAFAVAVKIDTLAYMPVQDFGNAFSTFVAQNFGADSARNRSGTRWAVFWVVVLGLVLGAGHAWLAPQLMAVFVGAEAVDVIAVGTGYLRIEGAFYLGIGILFLLDGYFRAANRPAVSGGAHGVLPGHPGGLGLCPLRPAGPGGYGDLDGHSHRLVPCRSGGHPPLAAGGPAEPLTVPAETPYQSVNRPGSGAPGPAPGFLYAVGGGGGIRPPRAPKSA